MAAKENEQILCTFIQEHKVKNVLMNLYFYSMKTWKIILIVVSVLLAVGCFVGFLIYRQAMYFAPDYHIANISKIEIIDTDVDAAIYITDNPKEIFEIAVDLHQSSKVENECPVLPQLKYTLRIYQRGIDGYSGDTDVYFTDGNYFQCNKGQFYKHQGDECYKFEDWGSNAIRDIIKKTH
jgi:hypothetical protein